MAPKPPLRSAVTISEGLAPPTGYGRAGSPLSSGDGSSSDHSTTSTPATSLRSRAGSPHEPGAADSLLHQMDLAQASPKQDAAGLPSRSKSVPSIAIAPSEAFPPGEPVPSEDEGNGYESEGSVGSTESHDATREYLSGPRFTDDGLLPGFTPEHSPLLGAQDMDGFDSNALSTSSTPAAGGSGGQDLSSVSREQVALLLEQNSTATSILRRKSNAAARRNDPSLSPTRSRSRAASGVTATTSAHATFALDSTPSRPRPRAFTLSHSAFGSFGTFPSTARSGPLAPPTLRSRIRLFGLQLGANLASAAFLVLIVIWALSSRGFDALYHKYVLRTPPRDRSKRDWDDAQKWKDEECVRDIRYYALSCGFDVEEHLVETKDGYLLKMYEVFVLDGKTGERLPHNKKGWPILIQHGLFQSCGSFVTSEERSLAFWLAKKGYQVWLGNNRGVFDSGHVFLKRSDPRFWDYNIKELALYDLPAMVDHVRHRTSYDRIAFIGHSQGNATMFCSLAGGMVPELGTKLSVFIALAPAVYAGPLTTGFPFGALKSMRWKTWRKWFGVLDFIPLMRWSYDWTPSTPFSLLGYQMFAFLFNWTDANWLLRRKPKTFRFTPSPVSSASIFWWTGYNGFSTRGCVLDPLVPKWYDGRFPPLALHHGSKDYLVLIDPLLKRLKENETDVKLLRCQEMKEGEHCDFFWHLDAVELCFGSIVEDIEATRDGR